MPGSIKKDLYIAKNIHDLNKLAAEIPKVNNARVYAKTAEKVYKSAEEAFMLGDEERSYVLYMKYFNVVSAIKKLADYKKQAKYFDDLIGKKNCINAITRAEELSANLKTRYEEAEALEVSKKLDTLDAKDPEKKNELEKSESSPEEKKPEGNGDALSDSLTKKQDDPGSKAGLATKGGGIDVQTVYRLLKDPEVNLILMDVRSAEDFEKSHILSEKSISVPEAAVPPGCTVSQIERQLPATSLKVWRSRGHVDYIIMLDWRCSAATLKPRSTLTYLKDALFKWDQDTILRSEPLILEGGYEEWIMCYPSLTTDSSIKCPLPPINGATSDMPSLDTIDYDVELEFLQSPTPSPIESPTTPLDEDSHSLPSTTRPLMPLIDRRTKPKPSSALNNSTDVARIDSQPLRIVNKIDNSDVRRRPAADDKTNNLPPSKTKVPEKNTNVTKVSMTPETVAPAAVIPTVDRTKKPVIGQDQPIGRRFSSSGSEDEADWPVARDAKSAGQRGMGDRGKGRVQSMEDEEMKKLFAIREVKDREVKSLAELMRMRKRMEEDMKKDEREAQRKKAERSDSTDSRKMPLSEEQRDNSSSAADNDSISSFEGEVDKKEIRGDSASGSPVPKAARQGEDEREPANGKPVELTKTSKENEKRKADEVKNKEQERLKREEEDEEEERLISETIKAREQERLKAEELRNREHEAETQLHLERETEKQRQLEREAEKQRQLEREAAVKREQEAARLKQQQEAARREQVEKELKEKERLEKERQEKERRARELEDAKLKAKQAETRAAADKLRKDTGASDVPALPAGWERRLHEGTGKYYYIDHKMKKTYWDPPGTVQQKLADGHATVYKERLKDEGSAESGSGGMKRSHSSPNIAKMIQDEEEAGRTMRGHVLPQVDRSIKPKPSAKVLTVKTEVSEAKVRNLNPTWGSMGAGLTGLRNLGNTCYMNSTLQCLSNAAPLTLYFLTDSYMEDIIRDSSRRYRGEVASEYAVLIKAMWSGQYKALSPRDFRGVICKMNSMFASTQHQDSHELLEILMNGLNEDLNKVRNKPQLPEQNNDNIADEYAADQVWTQSRLIEDSIIVDLFRGQYKSTVTCIRCDKKSVMFESFMCLNLPIPSPTRCSLSDCLLHFSKEEKMMGDSQWHCPRCKCKQDAIKRIVIWKLPPILIVHLERFYYQGIWRDKITANVDFPLDSLDMNRYISGPPKRPIYNLFAVSNHFGTLDGGHYTAFCKSPVAAKWYKFDDQDVSEISKSDIKSSAAYMLFYTSMKMDQLKM